MDDAMNEKIPPAGKGAPQTPSSAAMLTDAETAAVSGGGFQDIWEAAKIIVLGSTRGDPYGAEKARDFLTGKPSPLKSD